MSEKKELCVDSQRPETAKRGRENLRGVCFRDYSPVFVFESLSTHSGVWEQSGSPDETSKAEGKYTPRPPTPKEGLSVWGPTFLSTQRRLAWRQQ